MTDHPLLQRNRKSWLVVVGLALIFQACSKETRQDFGQDAANWESWRRK